MPQRLLADDNVIAPSQVSFIGVSTVERGKRLLAGDAGPAAEHSSSGSHC
jgi:hypothetical protein